MAAGEVLRLLAMAIGTVAVVATLRAVVKREPDRVIARMFVLGLLAKLAGSAARYTVMADLYGGRADFQRYFSSGTQLATQIRSGSLPDNASRTGTAFMEFVSGVVYSVMPPTLWAGFLALALLSFVGMFLFVQAFRLAVPEGKHRLYAALIYFTPTLVFWPSSLGKEAWLLFTLGVTAYGAARALKRRPFAYLLLGLGGAGAFMVRPHMAALFALAFVGAFVLRLGDRSIRTGLAGWMVGLVIIGFGAHYAFTNFEDELPRDESVEGTPTEQVFAETERRTTQGGSAYDSRPVRGPGDFFHAAITVPFRPFPTEGHNMQAQLAGLEGVFLILLCLVFLPRLVGLPRAMLRLPYVAMASAYSVGFIIAFSNVGNFGILARQRAQLLPFLFVLMAYDWHRRRDERGPLLVPKDDPSAEPTASTTPVPLAAIAAVNDGPSAVVATAATELVIDLPDGAIDHRHAPDGGSADSAIDP